MVNCWASYIGGCSHKQSGEHILSGCIFPSSFIYVKGLPSYFDESKPQGKAKLKRRILCTEHNSFFSPADTEARHFSETIGEIGRVNNVRINISPRRRWTTCRYSADGNLVERWLAKSIINFFYAFGDAQFWHYMGNPHSSPPADIVRAVFGQGQFPEPMGLYPATAPGDSITDDKDIKYFVELLHHPEGGFVGGIIQVRWLRLLIWLSDDHPPVLSTQHGLICAPGAKPIVRRPKTINFNISGKPSQVLDLHWS
jgi:hypothetical protein